MTAAFVIVVILLFLLVLFLFAAIKVAREYERGIVFRLGRLLAEPKGPGLFLLIPIVDRMVKVDLRTITLNIPPQEVITKDNVPVRVNAVAYFRIVEPKSAIVQVENFMVATSQIAQTTLRSVLGQHLLDELLAEREYQASERLKDAATVMAATPMALQLRYLQTLLELGSSQSTTIVFPAPIDILTPFIDKESRRQTTDGGSSA